MNAMLIYSAIRGYHVYNTICNLFVVEVFMAFITMIVVYTATTHQGQLLLMVNMVNAKPLC